ncbi:MAG: hypothetical protein N2510_03040 [Ignavibacteria bacterium]|nr:hypothetical protein [Ignavibacteria bacterium]
MKKILYISLALLVINTSYAQFKEIPERTKTKLKSGLILGFINPENFSLTHSFNISYYNSGNTNISLTSYTATVGYKISDNMNLDADITMQYSPYASINHSNITNKEFQRSLSGISLSRVSFNYRPFKNMFININYYNNSNSFYGRYYKGFLNPFWDVNY